MMQNIYLNPKNYFSATHVGWDLKMPAEIFDVEEFIRLSEKAEYCRIKRLKDVVKLKLRTRKRLYTLKVDPAKVDEIVKNLKCEIREV